MKSLWSAIVNSILTSSHGTGGGENGYVLTEQDKAEIANRVLQSLPQAPESGEEKLEYINTVTAPADTQTLICDCDSEGNEVCLKKFVIIIRSLPRAESTSSTGSLYSCLTLDPEEDLTVLENATAHRANVLNYLLSQTEIKHGACAVTLDAIEEHTADGVRVAIFHGEPSLYESYSTTVPSNSKGFYKMGIYTPSITCLIGAGTSITVYGIRA